MGSHNILYPQVNLNLEIIHKFFKIFELIHSSTPIQYNIL